MSGNKDIYTFQYGELKKGQTYALAMARVVDNFVHSSFHDSPNYERLLLSIFEHISKDPSMDDKMLQALENALMARQNAVLKEARDNDKDRKKFVFEKRTTGRDPNEDSGSDAEEVTEEELAARKAAQEAEEKRKEQEWIKAQERYAALQLQKRENEERLRAQARKVDIDAFQRQLQSRGAVLVDSGLPAKKKGGKGAAKVGQLSAEDAAKMREEVALIVKEKERLDTALHTSDEELPAALEEARRSLAEYKQRAAAIGEPAAPTKEMSKGELTQLQQKLAKQTMDKNRRALQLKAMEPNPLRDELVSVLEQRDELAVTVERAENA
ncbi:conserved hypothetical protein [Leishmania major strain Friedlin]|uniref:Uncharacterized protein n=1 Tax=Leishmania major TaxID=5664 RepID=Q4Q7Q0_LEIMA|nr:conserved hypothetical protein [Leishmania major strain Friedlin]CAG9578204.1 hypothetical_protein_-_conserved [Leishmania major strain Friedlin]CAJ05932.1 conserved hypothetical protein [Leishmania major strain Friedlin]|eukprot:XP_001684646.1 conserved hypothetical protein [Leishmania major strain Friedlin]